MCMTAGHLTDRLERAVETRTHHRIVGLTIDVEEQRIVLRGRAGSFHVKQLAICGVRDVLPNVPLRNEIVVESYRVAS